MIPPRRTWRGRLTPLRFFHAHFQRKFPTRMEATMKTRSLFIVTVLFSLCAVAYAQPKPRLLDKESFMNMESVGAPEISPDGKQIIFTRTWVDRVKDQYRSNLWIVDVDGSRVRAPEVNSRTRLFARMVARRQARR